MRANYKGSQHGKALGWPQGEGWMGLGIALLSVLLCNPLMGNKLAQDEAERSIHHYMIPNGALAELPSPTCSVALPSHPKTWDLKDLWGSSTPLTSSSLSDILASSSQQRVMDR